mmetsp:Transcript_6947/g.42444  ORF Transcript_6947/g.42444 Transcript_6947/m.42444 type:complete len:201 (-) Transcript_6947:747-1349(-)
MPLVLRWMGLRVRLFKGLKVASVKLVVWIAGGNVCCWAIIDVLPVNASEEGVLFDFLHALGSQSVVNVTEESGDEVLGLFTHQYVTGELEVCLPVDNFPAGPHWIIGIERRVTSQHFKKNGTHGPPITLHAISFLEQDLWGDVVRCTYSRKGQRPSILFPPLHFLLPFLARFPGGSFPSHLPICVQLHRQGHVPGFFTFI